MSLRYQACVLVDNASEKELLKLILHVKLPDAKLTNCEPGRLLPRPLNYHHFRHPSHALRTLGAARLAAEVAEGPFLLWGGEDLRWTYMAFTISATIIILTGSCQIWP